VNLLSRFLSPRPLFLTPQTAGFSPLFLSLHCPILFLFEAGAPADDWESCRRLQGSNNFDPSLIFAAPKKLSTSLSSDSPFNSPPFCLLLSLSLSLSLSNGSLFVRSRMRSQLRFRSEFALNFGFFSDPCGKSASRLVFD